MFYLRKRRQLTSTALIYYASFQGRAALLCFRLHYFFPLAMSSNLNYLDPALQPLQDKIASYLAAEKELERAEIEAANIPSDQAREKAEASTFEQRPPTGSYDQHPDEVQQHLGNLRDDLTLLRREIIGMLPVLDEWVKVNLGYGPSRVGAFRVTGTPDNEPQHELRVIQ
jgi:hypothetical protein